MPIFLAALFRSGGYRRCSTAPLVPKGRVAVSTLMQATSLPFIVAATAIGLELKVVTPGNAAALIAAGLLSVVLFPAAALTLLKRDPATRARMDAAPADEGMPPVGEAM